MSEKQEAICFGTKERDTCGCGGDKNKCTYYDEIREKAKLKQQNSFQEDENIHVEHILNSFGIHTRNDDTGEYLAVNEVMISVAKTLRSIKENNDDKYYQISKETIMNALLGVRYRYELS